MDPLPPDTDPPPAPPPGSPGDGRFASPDIDGRSLRSSSPIPDPSPLDYDECPQSNYALAAFQTPKTLEVLVHAFDQHDLQIALGLRLDPGMRLHVVSPDKLTRRSSSTSSLEIRSKRRASSDDEKDTIQVAEPQPRIIKGPDDTETDGDLTPTPENPISIKKKKKKTNKKKKGKEKEEEWVDTPRDVNHVAKDEAAQREELSVEMGSPAADETAPSSPLVTSLDSPDTPIAQLPLTPPSESTQFELDVQYPSERRLVDTIPEEKDILPVEPTLSDLSIKFVTHVLSLAMTLTPPSSPPTEPSPVQLAVEYPAPTNFVPPIEPSLPTPLTSASLLNVILSQTRISSPVQRQTAEIHDTVHLLDKTWTLYFSDTSDKSRQARKISASSAEDYSTGLFTIFTASTLEDVFGGWKALRRRIASSKRFWIEPEGTPIQRGAGGLGVSHMGDDNNFHFFVQGIKPMWEDPMCSQGGKIMFAGSGSQVSTASLLEPF